MICSCVQKQRDSNEMTKLRLVHDKVYLYSDVVIELGSAVPVSITSPARRLIQLL